MKGYVAGLYSRIYPYTEILCGIRCLCKKLNNNCNNLTNTLINVSHLATDAFFDNNRKATAIFFFLLD